jgi:hypothetical protein
MKSQHALVSVIITVLGLFLLPGCNKKEPMPFAISAQLKSFFNYQQGSYWIMRDSVSGEIDSLVVVGYENGVMKPSSETVEIIKITVKNFPYARPDTSRTFFIQLLATSTVSTFSFLFPNNATASFFGIDPVLNSPNRTSYVQNGLTYSNCYDVTSFERNAGSLQMRLVMNADTGLIKLSTDFPHDSSVLELQKSKIYR